METNITVNVRVRPLLAEEDMNIIKYVHGEPPVLMVSDKRYVYALDNIFSSEVHQCEVYNVTVKPLVSRVLDGYNSAILAYGQTGTGKTYTMGTDSERYHDTDSGLIPRVLDEFFDVSIRDPAMTISISFIEIYNEKVYDLLRPSKTPLVVKGFCVNGMTCVSVEHNENARHWLLVGGKGRHVRHTALNASSSRSHAIFTVYCTRTDTGVTSKLHLVDLAGSESVRRTGNQGQAFQEGITINRGLLAVGRVISALSDKHTSVIPYRDSTLTTILHDSLSINNYVSLLACVSPSETDISETLATLRFAVKARSVKSRPQLDTIIMEYDKANPGILGNIEPLTTIKKNRKIPAIFTSTQIKKPLFGKRNVSIQSIEPTRDRFTSSPNYASTMDSLSISTSTTIDAPKQSFNLSPLVRRCTEVLQNTVLEHVNNIINEKITATPALFSKNQTINKDKENTSPSVIVHWPTIETRMTEIIRKELAELTSNERILNKTKHISSPQSKRHLKFDDSPLSSELGNNLVSPKPEEHLFKVPIPIHRTIKRVRDSEIDFIAPMNLRRSSRLSMKAPDEIPTPAPRIKSLNPQTYSSPFKLTRRSVRLSMKCIAPIATPKSLDSSFERDFLPIPAPRNSIKLKTPAKIKTTPKNIKIKKMSTPKKTHRKNILILLNKGTQKELQSLATVGIKTAIQIVTYRSLNEEFKSFDDLKNIPTWREKKFEKFMLSNQLL